MSLRSALLLVLVALLSHPGWGSAAPAPVPLEQRIYRSFVQGDYAEAAELIEQFLEQAPNDAVMLYNAACAYSQLGERDRAASSLFRAFEAGWRDLNQIVRDPDLQSIRDHPTYLALVERLRRPVRRRADTAAARWRATYGDDRYRYETDDERGIAYATALDPLAHHEMRQMLERQADHLRRTLLGPSLEPSFLIAVPTPQDAELLFAHDRIGGIYDHRQRQLVARDIGGSLRHELVHALHYAHMDQLGQHHPLWIQEGLASLYEDYVVNDVGPIIFVPNERHNIVKRLAAVDRLTGWEKLFRMPDDRFMARANQLYPQVRSIFEFLAERGELGCWYRALAESIGEDPTGAKAFLDCFDMPVQDVERTWRRWLRARPMIDTSIDAGDAALGIESRPNARNDGVLITRLLPRSAASRSQLRVGDVIVSVDGKPTRSLVELQTVIAAKKVGQTVRVRARRAGDYFTVVVSLRPLQPMRW
ncbi:MAG: TPR end-of-group domain-containing protein [Planctomycetota bacterium]